MARSFIHIPDARTNGLIVLKTTLGDIKVGLWTKECPKATKNFVQLCADGYYDGNLFFKVIKDFVAITGDQTNTGDGGKSIYNTPFRDEIHSRLRFKKRGLLATANKKKNENNSQFFFTLGPAEELQGKHTIFGRVLDDSVFNLLKLNDCEVDNNDKPTRGHKILSTQIIENPYPGIKFKEQYSSSPQLSKETVDLIGSDSDSSFISDEENEVKKSEIVQSKKKLNLETIETSSGEEEESKPVDKLSQKRLADYEDFKEETNRRGPYKKFKRAESSSSSSTSDNESESSSSSSAESDVVNSIRARELEKIKSQFNKIKEELAKHSNTKPEATPKAGTKVKPSKEREADTLRKLNLFKNKLKTIADIDGASSSKSIHSNDETSMDILRVEEDFDLDKAGIDD